VKRFSALLGMAVAALAFGAYTPSADAYLHVANAQAKCAPLASPYFDAWSKQNVGPGNVYNSAVGGFYQRLGDNVVVVDCVMLGNWGGSLNPGVTAPWYAYPHSQGEVRAEIVGPDGSEGIYLGGGYPQWWYLSWETTDYWNSQNGCPNYGGWCVHGGEPYGF
jgi:hypothetical protein